MSGLVIDKFVAAKVRMLEQAAKKNGLEVERATIWADGRVGVSMPVERPEWIARAIEDSRPKERFVYFIRAQRTRLIKIGVADDVLKRMRSLQGASPDKLVLIGVVAGSQNTEAIFHSVLSDHRKHGEWFKNGPMKVEVYPRIMSIQPMQRGDTEDSPIRTRSFSVNEWMRLGLVYMPATRTYALTLAGRNAIAQFNAFPS